MRGGGGKLAVKERAAERRHRFQAAQHRHEPKTRKPKKECKAERKVNHRASRDIVLVEISEQET